MAESLKILNSIYAIYKYLNYGYISDFLNDIFDTYIFDIFDILEWYMNWYISISEYLNFVLSFYNIIFGDFNADFGTWSYDSNQILLFVKLLIFSFCESTYQNFFNFVWLLYYRWCRETYFFWTTYFFEHMLPLSLIRV